MARRMFFALAVAVLIVGSWVLAQESNAPGERVLGAIELKRTGPGESKVPAALAIPWRINYQGYLTDEAGNPVNDTLSMTLRIYTASVAGTELWSEGQSISVEGGLFNVILGSAVPVPADIFEAGASRWLELEVETQVLSPRTEITSVGYAYRAVVADSADVAVTSDMVDGFNASATPGAGDLFPVSYGDSQYVNEGQIDAINTAMIIDGTVARADAQPAFKAPYADTADYALSAPAAADSDWVVTGNLVHPIGDYGLAMRGSNVSYGTGDSTHVNLGVACTTGISGYNSKYCTVGGGWSNEAGGQGATVGGGAYNDADSTGATVSGGSNNRSRGVGSVVAGGQSNDASGSYPVIGGGQSNFISNNHATIAGGYNNRATGWQTSVGGGWGNTASGKNSSVSGGNSNEAAGGLSAVGGGWADTVAGYCSFVAGRQVRIGSLAGYTFAFGRDFTTSTPNAVVFHNSVDPIRVGIGVSDPTNYISVAGGAYCDGSDWYPASSRTRKKDIRSLGAEEYRDILQSVRETDVVRFRYKTQGDDNLRLGLIAEEAPEEMVDSQRKAVSTGGSIAFLLAALKAQQEEIELLKRQIEELKR